jgi:hypothetical protein
MIICVTTKAPLVQTPKNNSHLNSLLKTKINYCTTSNSPPIPLPSIITILLLPSTTPQNFGLLPNGIGGGPPAPPKSFFFGGGGGGAFFPSPPVVGDGGGGGLAFDPEARLFTLPAIPYFWFKLLAVFHPAATCSPWRSRKLFAVEAALRASERVTLEGSLCRVFTVLRAACFSAHVVPVAGGAEGVV